MKTFFIPAIIVVLIVGIGGVVFLSQRAQSPNGANNEPPAANNNGGDLTSGTETPPGETNIIYANEGYSPQSITVKSGSSVTFTNEGSRQNWPASDIHPTHTLYPGSSIQKCETSERTTIFDACRGLSNGEKWPFTFTHKGAWRYHNHLAPNHTGTIIVE